MAEFERSESEAISLRIRILLDVSLFLKRCEQAEHIILVQPQASRQFGYADLVVVAEGTEHPQGIRHRLDLVVALRLLHRRGSSAPLYAPPSVRD